MEEIIFDGIRELLHNLKMWSKSRWHLHKAKKTNNIVELLISMCYDEEETKWQYTKDKTEIICEIGSGTYHSKREIPAPLTLTDAFHIPLGYSNFVKQLIDDQKNWPQGVFYHFAKGPDYKLAITVNTALDYTDDPKGYLRGYMEYLHDLQLEIHKAYNAFRQTHSEGIETPTYNINI